MKNKMNIDNYQFISGILTNIAVAALSNAKSMKHFNTTNKIEILSIMQNTLLESPESGEREKFEKTFKIIKEVLGQSRINHVSNNIQAYLSIVQILMEENQKSNVLDLINDDEFNLKIGERLLAFSKMHCK